MLNGMLMVRFVVFRHPLRYLLKVGRGWEVFSSLTLVFDFMLPHHLLFVLVRLEFLQLVNWITRGTTHTQQKLCTGWCVMKFGHFVMKTTE